MRPIKKIAVAVALLVTGTLLSGVDTSQAIASENSNRASTPPAHGASSLTALVAATPVPVDVDEELHCLAGAVYFESRSEPLAGQLAVAYVVIGRVASERFPSTLCSVVYQKKQFGFVRSGRIPKINTQSSLWTKALTIAQIAREERWKNTAPGALFFHAHHVSPRWKKAKIAHIGNHIFYR